MFLEDGSTRLDFKALKKVARELGENLTDAQLEVCGRVHMRTALVPVPPPPARPPLADAPAHCLSRVVCDVLRARSHGWSSMHACSRAEHAGARGQEQQRLREHGRLLSFDEEEGGQLHR